MNSFCFLLYHQWARVCDWNKSRPSRQVPRKELSFLFCRDADFIADLEQVTDKGQAALQSNRCTVWNQISHIPFPSLILTEQHLRESFLTSLGLSPPLWNVHPSISHEEFYWLLISSGAQWLLIWFIKLFLWIFFMRTSRIRMKQSPPSRFSLD